MLDVDIQVPWTGWGPHHSGFIASEEELDPAFSTIRSLVRTQQINANQDGKERVITLTITVKPNHVE